MKNILSILLIVLFVSSVGFAQDYSSGLLERSQIPEKYKWDTGDLYENENTWQMDYTWIEKNITQYDGYRGRLGESGQVSLECLQFDEKMKRKLDDVWLYAKLNRDVNMGSEMTQEMWSKYNILNAKVEAARSFITSEIISLPEDSIEKYLNEISDLKPYSHYFETLEKRREHTLSEDKEDLLARASQIIDNPYRVFGSLVYAELSFPVILNDQGEEIQLNRSTSWRARSSQDRSYRKTAIRNITTL